MDMNLMKRVLSLLLALMLLLGNVPVAAFATEEETVPATEAAAVEETAVPTVAETEPATEPVQETVAPSEATTEPAVEETTAPTQSAVPEETVAPTEAPNETTATTEEAVPTEGEPETDNIAVERQTIAPDLDLPDNQELHTAYIEQVLYGNRSTVLGSAAGARLSGDEKVLYDALVPVIKQIASGKRASVVIGVGQTVTDNEGNTYVADVEATFAGTSLSSDSMNSVMEALLSDLPFEMYWHDKTAGCGIATLAGSKLMHVQLTFAVAGNYQGTAANTVDTAKTAAAANAVSNAEKIVSEYAAASDYEKLTGYRDEICALVSYNNGAANAGNFSENDDPWQLVYVFDGDTSTNVVCEGYSKAFMYLCDLTSFSGSVSCYTVSGWMNGGDHMWNIVTLEGSNYLVDVTNSDADTVGQDGSLFLAGAAGSAAEGYTCNGIGYVYDSNTQSLWGTGAGSILTIASENYTPQTGGGEEEDENLIASGTCGDNLTWALDDEGTLTISGTGEMADYESEASEKEDYIEAPWSKYWESIKNAKIEAGVTSIGDWAFYFCSSLTSVEIPNSVTSIGEGAFSSSNLTSINIPDSVTSIGRSAFWCCSSLTSVEISDSVASIEGGTFFECYSLEHVSIPNSVTSIGDWAFYFCSSLTSIEIPDSVTSIGSGAFSYCNLTSVEIPDSVTSIGEEAFSYCDSLTSIEIPASVTSIGEGTFSYCDSLTSIKIPASVTSIGSSAFWCCSSLTSVEIPDSVTSIGSGAFGRCSSLTSIKIPSSVTSIGYSAFEFCSSLTSVTFEGDAPVFETFDGYDDGVFYQVTATVYYPANNPTWTADVMQDYGGSITWKPIPNGTCGENVTWMLDEEGTLTISGTGVMPNYAYNNFAPWYEYRSEIKSVVVREDVAGIGAHAFRDCANLTEAVIADSVTSMGGNVFWNCTGLTSVTLGSGLTEIPVATFYKCTSLTSVDIPVGITSIGTNAFQSCTGLRAIYIPSTVTGMPSTSNTCAFYDCDESLAIYCGHEAEPSGWGDWNGDLSVSYGYSKDEFEYWTSFDKTASTVQIADGITRIPNKAFYNFTNLENVYIPDSVTAIGSNAFSGCTSLRNLYIPAGVSVISAEEYDLAPFYDCDDLLQVYFGAAQEQESWDYYWDCYASSTYHITKHFGYTRAEYDYWMGVDKTVSSLVIPEGITKIPDYFFRGREYIRDEPLFGSNTTLRSVTIPSSLTTIGEYAFEYCKALTKVTLADGVECIGRGAFLGCTGLNNISIPASVKLVDYYAFDECENLVIKYAGTMLEWANVSESRLKAVCSDGTIVDYGSCGIGVSWLMDNKYTLTIFGDGAMTNYDYYWKVPWYDYTSYITSVKILDGVNSIGTRAFYGCTKLTSVTISETVVNIEAYAFSKCTALKSITIPRSVNYIGVEAFYNNKALATITFRHGINDELTIDLGAFVTFDKTKETTVRVPNKTEINAAIKSYDWSGALRKVTYKSHNCDGKHYVVSEDAVEATCTQDGRTGKCYCEVCGTVLNEDTVIPALGHDVDKWEIDREAIYTEAGERHGNCTRCSEFVSETIPALGLPDPVVQVVSDPVTGGGILNWEHDGEADGYEIYRATSKTGKYTLLSTVEETEVNVSVSAGKTYYYKVKAICDANPSLSSGYSAAVKVTGKCAQPEITIEAKATTGKPVIQWSKISGAKKYEVYRATAIDGTYKKVKTVTSASYTDTAAAVGTTYFYKVKAVASKSAYNSVYSQIESCLTVLAQPVVTLKIDTNLGKPALSWKAISGATAYEILRAESADGAYTRLASLTDLSFVDISAAPDKDYWYKVNALGAEEALNSADGTAKMIHATLAKPVVTFSVDDVSGKPVLTWEAVPGAVEYQVYRSTSATKSYKAIATTADTEYTDTAASVGKGYYYKVIAIGEGSKSGYSSYKKLTAKCAQPDIAVEASETSGKPVITWSKISGAKKYYVYRVDEVTGIRTSIGSTTKTTFTDSKAVVGTAYSYQVRANGSKSAYNSIYSEIQSCLTVLGQPVVTLKTVAASGKPTLSWKTITDASGYEIYRAENDGAFTLIATLTELTFTDENAVVDGVYSYKVNAIAEDTALNSADGTPMTVTAACAQPMVSITLDGKKPMVSWESVEGAVKYEVYRSTKKGSGYKKVATVEEGETYTDSKAKNGTTYYYQVVAVSENTSSAYSNVVKIKSK